MKRSNPLCSFQTNQTLDARQLTTDLQGNLISEFGEPKITNINELFPEVSFSVDKRAVYTIDFSISDATYRLKGRKDGKMIHWHFTDISDLSMKKAYDSRKFDGTDICEFAYSQRRSVQYSTVGIKGKVITAKEKTPLRVTSHSIDERDMLLKEIHHRVKNNLQIISSILYLKSMQLHDAESRKVIEECNQRIRSMHMIHENLLKEHDLSNIHIVSYLEGLIKEVYQTFRLPGQQIRLRHEIQPLCIGANQVMTIAMIIYELLSNALLHAFCGREKGSVTVSLQAWPTGVHLCVKDDGVGLPDNKEWEESLGILLVKTFAAQIKAVLKIDSSAKGSHFCIIFSDKS